MVIQAIDILRPVIFGVRQIGQDSGICPSHRDSLAILNPLAHQYFWREYQNTREGARIIPTSLQDPQLRLNVANATRGFFAGQQGRLLTINPECHPPPGNFPSPLRKAPLTAFRLGRSSPILLQILLEPELAPRILGTHVSHLAENGPLGPPGTVVSA